MADEGQKDIRAFIEAPRTAPRKELEDLLAPHRFTVFDVRVPLNERRPTIYFITGPQSTYDALGKELAAKQGYTLHDEVQYETCKLNKFFF